MLYLVFFPFERSGSLVFVGIPLINFACFFGLICVFCLEQLPRLSVFIKKHSTVCICLCFLADSIFKNYCKFICESAVTVAFFFQSLATTSTELEREPLSGPGSFPLFLQAYTAILSFFPGVQTLRSLCRSSEG